MNANNLYLSLVSVPLLQPPQRHAPPHVAVGDAGVADGGVPVVRAKNAHTDYLEEVFPGFLRDGAASGEKETVGRTTGS